MNRTEKASFSLTMATAVQCSACMLALLMLTAAGVGAAEKQSWDGPAFSGDPATIARVSASAPAQEGPAQDDLSQRSFVARQGHRKSGNNSGRRSRASIARSQMAWN